MQRLRIKIRQIGKAAASQEVILEIIHHTLDLAFRSRPIRSMGTGRKPIVVCKIEKLLIPLRSRLLDRLHVVVQNRLRPAVEERKRLLMAIDQLAHSHGCREAHIHHSRIGQHDDEGIDRYRFSIR